MAKEIEAMWVKATKSIAEALQWAGKQNANAKPSKQDIEDLKIKLDSIKNYVASVGELGGPVAERAVAIETRIEAAKKGLAKAQTYLDVNNMLMSTLANPVYKLLIKDAPSAAKPLEKYANAAFAGV